MIASSDQNRKTPKPLRRMTAAIAMSVAAASVPAARTFSSAVRARLIDFTGSSGSSEPGDPNRSPGPGVNYDCFCFSRSSSIRSWPMTSAYCCQTLGTTSFLNASRSSSVRV